jgi:hypothetical protein
MPFRGPEPLLTPDESGIAYAPIVTQPIKARDTRYT